MLMKGAVRAVGRVLGIPYAEVDQIIKLMPDDPRVKTIEEAIELIKSKADAEKKKVVKKFDEEPELEILNGPYGVYIAYKKKNYKIPKGTDAESLTVEDCKKIIEDAANAPKKPRRATARKK